MQAFAALVVRYQWKRCVGCQHWWLATRGMDWWTTCPGCRENGYSNGDGL